MERVNCEVVVKKGFIFKCCFIFFLYMYRVSDTVYGPREESNKVYEETEYN